MFSGDGTGILQSSFDVLRLQRREGFQNFSRVFSSREHLQNLPDHDARSFKGGLAVADLGIGNDVFADLNSIHGVSIAEEERLSKEDLNPRPQWNKVTRKSGRWVKVAALQEGDTIAVLGSDGTAVWEKIVAIECLPPEQVYDIEVEGTHNFVAGHYVNQRTGKALSPQEEEAYLRRVKGQSSKEKILLSAFSF